MSSNQSYRVYLRVILEILFFNLLLRYCSISASGFVIGGSLRSANNEFFIKEIVVLFGKIIICVSNSSRGILLAFIVSSPIRCC